MTGLRVTRLLLETNAYVWLVENFSKIQSMDAALQME